MVVTQRSGSATIRRLGCVRTRRRRHCRLPLDDRGAAVAQPVGRAACSSVSRSPRPISLLHMLPGAWADWQAPRAVRMGTTRSMKSAIMWTSPAVNGAAAWPLVVLVRSTSKTNSTPYAASPPLATPPAVAQW